MSWRYRCITTACLNHQIIFIGMLVLSFNQINLLYLKISILLSLYFIQLDSIELHRSIQKSWQMLAEHGFTVELMAGTSGARVYSRTNGRYCESICINWLSIKYVLEKSLRQNLWQIFFWYLFPRLIDQSVGAHDFFILK